MSIAVIIPVYNGEGYLRRTLESVFSQTRRPEEVIVIDDGSSDASLAIAKTFDGLTILTNPDKGANSARQFGIQQSTADNIAFLDQDDIWHPAHLRLLSQALDQFPDSAAAFGHCTHFYFDRERLFSSPADDFQRFDPWQMFPTNSVATPSAALIRRQALARIGGWPIHLVGCADVYTWYRLGTDRTLVKNRSATVGYRKHGNSMSMSLRSQKFQTYFDNLTRAMQDALTRRLTVDNRQAQRLQKRLGTVAILPRLVAAIGNSEPALLRAAATEFEESLAGEPEDFICSMCNLLLFFMYPHLTQKPALDNVLLAWPRSTPQSTPQTSKLLLRNIVASRVFLQQLMAHPFDRLLWSALIHNQTLLKEKSLQYFSRYQFS